MEEEDSFCVLRPRPYADHRVTLIASWKDSWGLSSLSSRPSGATKHMDASRATKRRRVSEHFEKEDESEPDCGEAIETQESVMRVAEFPIETNVYIINKASNRKLYAQGTKNWQEGFGAGSPPSAVHADGVWRIVREDGGFRILNEYSQRCLYAAAGHNWGKKARRRASHLRCSL